MAENSLKFQRIKRNLAQFATYPANYANFMHFALNSSISSSLVSDLWPSTENPGKLEWINQILRSLPTTPANYGKFAESAPITSRLGVNPGNSRKVQWTTQVLPLSHNAPANNAKFATFAHKYKISNLFLHILHMFHCIYSTYMHTSCTIVD